MGLSADQMERGSWIVRELLTRREPIDGPKWWGDIYGYTGKEEAEQKRIANAFLLSCLVDYRRREKDDPWDAIREFLKSNPEFQDELWRKIHDTPYATWCSEAEKHKLHWMRRPHDRLWTIAGEICYWFDGDARLIWRDQDAFSTLARLYWIGAGEQISRMIVGALKDCGIVFGKGDPKGDVRVCRVVGRSVTGEKIDPAKAFVAVQICRELHPQDPWELDRPLWLLGEKICTEERPNCANCYLCQHCAFNQRSSV